MSRPASRGMTLVELMVVIVVLAILVGLSVPSLIESAARRRLEGAANELGADLQYARSQAVASDRPVLVCLAGTSTYWITHRTACPAAGDALSAPEDLKKVDVGPAHLGLTGTAIQFLPLRGCPNSSGDFTSPTDSCAASGLGITLSSSQIGGDLRAEVSNMGRVRMCGSFTGYAAC